jgi:hypothetical protein
MLPHSTFHLPMECLTLPLFYARLSSLIHDALRNETLTRHGTVRGHAPYQSKDIFVPSTDTACVDTLCTACRLPT